MLESADTETVTTGHHGKAPNSVPGAIMITPAVIAAVGQPVAPPFHATDHASNMQRVAGVAGDHLPNAAHSSFDHPSTQNVHDAVDNHGRNCTETAQQPRKSWAVVRDPLK